jgi:hypothetical protein
MSEILIGVSEKDGQPSITVNGIPVSAITASAVGAALLAIGRELGDVEQAGEPTLSDLAPAFLNRNEARDVARPRTL